jgi:hypothetical protein
MRVHPLDGVMARAALHLYGRPYDLADGIVAYNALLQMGLFPSLFMDNEGSWDDWTNPTLEAALADVKNKLSIGCTVDHDEFLMALLRQKLTFEDGRYVWPRGVHSALIYWKPREA